MKKAPTPAPATTTRNFRSAMVPRRAGREISNVLGLSRGARPERSKRGAKIFRGVVFRHWRAKAWDQRPRRIAPRPGVGRSRGSGGWWRRAPCVRPAPWGPSRGVPTSAVELACAPVATASGVHRQVSQPLPAAAAATAARAGRHSGVAAWAAARSRAPGHENGPRPVPGLALGRTRGYGQVDRLNVGRAARESAAARLPPVLEQRRLLQRLAPGMKTSTPGASEPITASEPPPP